ncbi:MAG: hypothetical protein AAF570_04300, partial [Bacteroidota bacterium]
MKRKMTATCYSCAVESWSTVLPSNPKPQRNHPTTRPRFRSIPAPADLQFAQCISPGSATPSSAIRPSTKGSRRNLIHNRILCFSPLNHHHYDPEKNFFIAPRHLFGIA